VGKEVVRTRQENRHLPKKKTKDKREWVDPRKRGKIIATAKSNPRFVDAPEGSRKRIKFSGGESVKGKPIAGIIVGEKFIKKKKGVESKKN